MAEHFLSLVERDPPFLFFSGFIPISHRFDKKKKTNKQKKQLPNITVERFVFFEFHSNYSSDGNKQTKKSNFQISLLNDLFFSSFIPIIHRMETNKQKKATSKYHCWTIFFSSSIPISHRMETNKQKKNFKRKSAKRLCKGWKKKHQRFAFFSIFVPKPFGERCCCCSLRHFIATNVFALKVCFCSKAFLLLLKKEKFTCADKTFFYLVLGTRGLDKQIKNIFFRWSKPLLESEKKRAKIPHLPPIT